MRTDQENLTPEENRDLAQEPNLEARREDVIQQPEVSRELTSEPLFAEDIRKRHQQRWESIQTSFVDDPRRSVQEADALVADLTKQVQESFAEHRRRLESAWTRGTEASTEDLRRALQQYRSYFSRLLSM